MPLGEKEMASLCARGCMIAFSRGISLRSVELFIDKDTSLIRGFTGREQAHRSVRGFIASDVGTEYFQAQDCPPDSVGMLEVADLIAYVAQKSAMVSSKPSALEAAFGDLNRQLNYERARLLLEGQSVVIKLIDAP